MKVAGRLGGSQGDAIATAAKDAFIQAHGSVLAIVAAMIGALAIAVFVALRNAPAATSNH